MKFYYDFDMKKTFTEEELKRTYEEIKNDTSYCDFDDFIQCEKNVYGRNKQRTF